MELSKISLIELASVYSMARASFASIKVYSAPGPFELTCCISFNREIFGHTWIQERNDSGNIDISSCRLDANSSM